MSHSPPPTSHPGLSKDGGQSSRILAKEQQIAQHTHVKAKADRKKIVGRSLNFDEKFTPPKYHKTSSDVQFLDLALGENFIFSDLSDTERQMLIDAMQEQRAEEGDIIIKQGDVGDFFYIVESGNLNFVVDGNHVGSCGSGGSFGELALLYDAPRAATCVAATNVKLWKVDQTTFRHLIAKQTKDKESDIQELVAKVQLLKDLDQRVVSKFAQVLTTVRFAEGELIVQKGDVGDIFYIINEGQVKVHDIGMGDSRFADQILKAGDWFGERALITGEPRAANVTAMTNVTAFACDRDTFESTIGSLETILGRETKKRFLKGVPIFASSELLDIEYDRLVQRLEKETFPKGTKLAEAGKAAPQKLLIVQEGKLMVSNKDGKIFFLGSGDYFGDKGVKAERGALGDLNCTVDEDTTCWVLKREDIERVIIDIKRLGEPIPFTPSTINTSIQLKDIKKHRILGMGTST